MWTNTGSLHYRAPESFCGMYDYQIDIWAIGILTYELLTGKTPFRAQLKTTVIEMIKSEEIDFESLSVSNEAKVFLERTLDKNPLNRIKAHDAL